MVFVLHQIELDLLRTLPNNRHYASVDSPGICKLRNVLLAYSWHNPSIGYCQVGVALTLNSYSRSKSVDSYSDYLPVPLPMFASYISNLHVIPPSSHFNSILTKIHQDRYMSTQHFSLSILLHQITSQACVLC